MTNQNKDSEILLNGVEAIDTCVKIQCSDGNWNCDPYMHGLANGLLLAQSFFKEGGFNPLNPPDKWLCDIDQPPEG